MARARRARGVPLTAPPGLGVTRPVGVLVFTPHAHLALTVLRGAPTPPGEDVMVSLLADSALRAGGNRPR